MSRKKKHGSLREDFRVNRSVLPGEKEARMMTVTSGLKCLESYDKQSPLGLFVKMLLISSTWNSNKRLLTWKAKDTKHKRLLFQLLASKPNIEEAEFGLWATPASADSRGSTGGGQSKSLRTDVRMWPTPTSRDWKDGKNIGKAKRNYLLGRSVEASQQSGSLNPNWVEWLMGYPIGWTDLKV